MRLPGIVINVTAFGEAAEDRAGKPEALRAAAVLEAPAVQQPVRRTAEKVRKCRCAR
jgi:hypothetical protein